MNTELKSIFARVKRVSARFLIDPLNQAISVLAGYPKVNEGVPPDCRLYVIGDIHGRIDLLREKHAQIEEDLARNALPAKPILVYLGDYIDGGGSSKDVIDTVMASAPEGMQTIALMGNHEQLMLNFLENADTGDKWFSLYGSATLESYGIAVPSGSLERDQFLGLQKSLRAKLPKSHLNFLKSLRPIFVLGDYAFVHAGIRPGTTLAGQELHDLLWIRDEFLHSRLKHEKVIVHGHSFVRRPQVRAHRIGIDTGSFFSGRLTCLVLEGRTHRFL